MSNQPETTIDEQEIPSREDVIKFYKEQNEILELRRDNARFQTEIANYEAERYEAIAKLAHYQGMLAKQEGGEKETKRELKKDK